MDDLRTKLNMREVVTGRNSAVADYASMGVPTQFEDKDFSSIVKAVVESEPDSGTYARRSKKGMGRDKFKRPTEITRHSDVILQNARRIRRKVTSPLNDQDNNMISDKKKSTSVNKSESFLNVGIAISSGTINEMGTVESKDMRFGRLTSIAEHVAKGSKIGDSQLNMHKKSTRINMTDSKKTSFW